MAGRVLIADTSATNRIALRAILQAARYDVFIAESAEDALRIAKRVHPTAVLIDADLASGDSFAALTSDPEMRGAPVIVMSAVDEAERRLAFLNAGADEIMSHPIHPRLLLARLRGAVRSRETAAALSERQDTVRDLGFAEAPAQFQTPARVSIVARSAASGEAWKSALAPHIRECKISAHTVGGFGEGGAAPKGDLFIIEADPAKPAEALGLLADLRSGADTRHAAIVVIHAPGDPDTAAIALDVGANDVVDSRLDAAEFGVRIAIQIRDKRRGDTLRASVEEGLRLAMVDPLTGLFNRRYAMTHANRLARECAPGRALGVILADIDRFKQVNDTWGHAAGDAVLKEIGLRLQENVRGKDTVARIGGEEFLILLPDAAAEAVPAAAHRLCAFIRDTPIPLPEGRPPVTITISLGVALAQPGEPIEEVIERADRALYEAKAAGRDTVTISGGACAA